MDPTEFVEKLQAGEFQQGLVLHGLVKESEEEEDTLQFAYGTSCENWRSIPVEKIESVDMLSIAPCKDHSHPFVRLSLAPPETDEAKFFADFLGSVTERGGQFGTPPRSMARTTAAPVSFPSDRPTAVPQSMERRDAPFRQARDSICTTSCYGGTMYCTCWSPERGWYEYPCGSCLPDPWPPWLP